MSDRYYSPALEKGQRRTPLGALTRARYWGSRRPEPHPSRGAAESMPDESCVWGDKQV